MKISLCLISSLIFSVCTFAQPVHNNYNQNKQVSVTGNIVMPALLSMNILNLNNAPVTFKTGADYNQGKTVPSFCTIEIKCNMPWQLGVAAATPNFLPLNAASSENVPVSIISIKKTGSGNYIPLSATEQVLFQNDNNKIQNSYSVDVKADPSWQYPGGTYAVDIVFTLTPQ